MTTVMPSVSIVHRHRKVNLTRVRLDDDDCYETYYDETDPFQDDNNNNYATTVNTNDPEQFECVPSSLKEVQARFEPSAFSASYVHTSSTPAVCSICLKSQTNFESLICNHAFCRDCWSQYIETNFHHHHHCISMFSSHSLSHA